MAQDSALESNRPRSSPTTLYPERREAERFAVPLGLSVSTENPNDAGLTVSPAQVRDISATGAFISTPARLEPRQSVVIAVPTDQCPGAMSLPEAFVGAATVMRAHQEENGRQLAAVRLGDAFHQNIDFAMFVDFIQAKAQVGPILSNTD